MMSVTVTVEGRILITMLAIRIAGGVDAAYIGLISDVNMILKIVKLLSVAFLFVE
jgi:hypothetical protein